MRPMAEPVLLGVLLSFLLCRVASGRQDVFRYTSAAEADRVMELPGYGPVEDFALFAGYVTVSERSSRRLFYILAESQIDPVNAPLLLWLNGGPGCSSVGGGFLTELGPWYPTRSGGLEINPHSWNSFANVLYLEAPAFVGFSYSRDVRDGDVGDKGTAEDNLSFLLGFFERFPDLLKNDFWLSGESYAGHYVPQLALEIVRHNECLLEEKERLAAAAAGSEPAAAAGAESSKCEAAAAAADARRGSDPGRRPPPPALNLVGLTLGNAWTDATLDNMGTVDHWWTHSMISDATFNGIRTYCDFAQSNPLDPHPDHRDPRTDDELCDHYCHVSDEEIGDVDIYDMITDDCREARARGEAVTLGRRLARAGLRAGLGVRQAATKGTQAAVDRILSQRGGAGGRNRSASWIDQGPAGSLLQAARKLRASGQELQKAAKPSHPHQGSHEDEDPQYEPCVEDFAETYLNRADVQLALHANQTRDWVPWRWVFCDDGSPLRYAEQDLQLSMLPLYDQLLALKSGLRILLYSGDADASVPALGTRYWLSELGLRQKGSVSWRTWSSSTGQVGGYLTVYKELQFATVRAAGHMVPYTQPERAHFLVSHFITGQELPK